MANLTKEEVAKKADKMAREERLLAERMIANRDAQAAMRDDIKKRRERIAVLAYEVEKGEEFNPKTMTLPGFENVSEDAADEGEVS